MTLRPVINLLAVLFALLGGIADRADAETRIALVIGNSAYVNVPRLNNPANDAADIAARLSGLGFAVTHLTDIDDAGMRRSLRDFAIAAEDADLAVFYFAGHGFEIDKVNYLIPVNARLEYETDASFEAIPLDLVLNSMAQSKGVRIVLIDACRNNPFLQDMSRRVASRSLGRGLARVDPAGGVLVGYAAREGTVALDGDGRNSPYATALLRHLAEPGLEIGKLFRKVRDTVFRMTDGRQEPFTYGSLPGTDIYLNPPLPASVAVGPAQDTIAADFVAAEKKGTLDAWTAFLDKHGAREDSPLALLARNRRDGLAAAADAAKQEAMREPWLVPKAGLPKFGEVTLDIEERRLVQLALGYMGFDTGGTDGQFGPKTMLAIAAARFREGLPPRQYVDRDLLKRLPNVHSVDALRRPVAEILSKETLPDDLEPRLKRVIETMPFMRMRFDYYRGHLYVAVGHPTHWNGASTLAQRAGGHLVTIADAAENQFVYDLFSPDPTLVWKSKSGDVFGPYIGLYQAPGSAEPAGGWAWVTGEPFTYRNWSRGNPDNYKNMQSYGQFYRSGRNASDKRPIVWDDAPSYPQPFIIEIE